MRRVVAKFLLLKNQRLISNCSRRRAPNLTMLDRLVPGLTTLFLCPHRILKTICEYQTGNPIQVPQSFGSSKLSPAVLLFIPETKAWPERFDGSSPLKPTRDRRIFIQCSKHCDFVVVILIRQQNVAQMAFAEHYDMINAFPPDLNRSTVPRIRCQKQSTTPVLRE